MIATLLIAALTGTPFPAQATYRYTGSMAGQRVGSWSVSVTHDPAQTQIDETSSASIFGMPLAATASLVLGPDYAPTKYNGAYHTPNQSPNVSVVATSSSATVVGALSTEPRQIELAPNTRHFVVIEPGLLAGLFALPAQLEAWKDSSVTWITPATAQAESLSANPTPSAVRPAGVATQDVELAIDRPVAVTIWYDPGTLVPDEITVPSQNAILTRVRS
ncbi:MAG: hypothetical protein WBE79_11085 [Candidatus Cybelea sp.]